MRLSDSMLEKSQGLIKHLPTLSAAPGVKLVLAGGLLRLPEVLLVVTQLIARTEESMQLSVYAGAEAVVVMYVTTSSCTDIVQVQSPESKGHVLAKGSGAMMASDRASHCARRSYKTITL